MRPIHLIALLAFCALGCASSAVPMGALRDTRNALDATTAPIRDIAEALTLLGPVLDEACMPVVVAPASELPAVAPPPADAPVSVWPALPPATPAPAAPGVPPPAPESSRQLLPPLWCARALPALDKASKGLDDLQDGLDVVNRGVSVVEMAAELASQ